MFERDTVQIVFPTEDDSLDGEIDDDFFATYGETGENRFDSFRKKGLLVQKNDIKMLFEKKINSKNKYDFG